MADRQWVIPGGGAVHEEGTEEYVLPGVGAIAEDQAAAAGGGDGTDLPWPMPVIMPPPRMVVIGY